ncbi:MAG: rRNA-processing protein bfr2 [Thelocarpon impressellum]|nr:MAG: rRNA-processing protein bfr2 [Thelocarpon impressellum]
MKRPKTLAEQITELGDPTPKDFDPEEHGDPPSTDDGSESDAGVDTDLDGREHYVDVGKSKLRNPEDVILGPRYSGSRVSRDALVDGESEEDDPFAQNGSDFSSEEEADEDADEDLVMVRNRQAAHKEDQDGDTFNGISGSTSEESHNEDDEDEKDEYSSDGTSENDDEDTQGDDRAALRKMMSESQKSVLASISQASKADAEKGQAVKHQRQTFDALLNTRIRLQKALIATNSMSSAYSKNEDPPDESAYAAAESAAVALWTHLDELRTSLHPTTEALKRKRGAASPSTPPLRTLWAHMKAHRTSVLPHRRATLEKWAAKARSTASVPTSRRLNSAVREQSLTDVLSAQLSGANGERLIARTRTPRSCAPVQAAQHKPSRKTAETNTQEAPSEAHVFDDADFYALLLKELVEQRTSTSSSSSLPTSSSALPIPTLKIPKQHRANLDTKASKGRKLRYTVHEKLQNFMAPEDRGGGEGGGWGERQVEELFSSLLGRRADLLGEDEDEDDEDEEMGPEEGERLRLF